jgi:hypothetical protein
MLLRYSRLRDTVKDFFIEEGQERLVLNLIEWNRLEYIIDITFPFAEVTTIISSTKEATLQLVLGTYNTLFNILDIAKAKLKKKQAL